MQQDPVTEKTAVEKCDLNLETSLTVCRTLYCLLTPGFGPNGLKTLLTTSTGQILITNSGSRILRSLSITHPVGKMIVSAAVVLQEQTGDCCKTFVIILTHLMKRASAYVDSRALDQSSSVSNRISLRKAACHLRRILLPELLLPKMMSHFSLTNICNENIDPILNVMTNLVRTYLSCRYSLVTASHLATVLVDLIVSIYNDISEVKNAVQLCIDSFENICIHAVGEHPAASHIRDGILFEKDFLFMLPSLSSMQEVRFVILCVVLEMEDESDEKTLLRVRTKDELHQALGWKQMLYSSCFKHLQNHSVSLLLCRGRITDLVNGICVSIGISTVQFVCEEDISRISQVFRIHPIYCLSDFVNLEVDGHIGTVKSCNSVAVGSRQFIHLVRTGPASGTDTSASNFTGKQVIICGPSPGVCEEIKIDLYSVLKGIMMWLNCGMSENSSALDAKTKGQKHSSTKLTGLSLPGGGTFEMLLYAVLCDILGPNSKQRLTDAEIVMCKILRDAVLEIPVLLLRNSYKQSSSSAITVQHLIDASLASCDNVLGLDGRTGNPLIYDTSIIEAVESKLCVLSSVLQLFEQILNLDMLVSGRKCDA